MFGFFNDDKVAKDAYEKVKNGKAVFVDIREQEELLSGLVKDALWLPMSKLDQQGWVEKVRKLSEQKEIFLYCRSGARATNLKNFLNQNGIEVENLGGFETLKSFNIPFQLQLPNESLLDLTL